MKKYLLALLALAVMASTAGKSNALTLQQLLVPGTQVTVGCLTFKNFRDLSITGIGSPTVVVGFGAGGSDIDLNFVEVSPGYVEVQYGPWDISNLGPGVFNRNLSFKYDVVADPGMDIIAVDGGGVFGATVAPPSANPGTNIANATFVNNYTPNVGPGVNVNLTGVKVNDGTFVDFVDQTVPIGPAQSITVVKDFLLQLVITQSQSGTLYNAHVSAYRQSYHYTPEPGTLALLVGFGVAGSLFAIRRRRA